ncbi:hypothetical protein ACOBQB_11685 [Streptomyces sp. G5(2025)]
MHMVETWSGDQVESLPNTKDLLGAGLAAWLLGLKAAAEARPGHR